MSTNIIEALQLDEERALYHLCHTTVKDCIFAGPADGVSWAASKLCGNALILNCVTAALTLWSSVGNVTTSLWKILN